MPITLPIFSFLFLLPFLSTVVALAPAELVSPDYMPPPWFDTASLCSPRISSRSRRHPAAVCDPSSLLSKRQLSRLDTIIDQIHTGRSPYSLVTCQDSSSHNPHGFRVAVALVRRMAFDGRTLSDRAQNFANLLFNNWGLNQNCGASVLLFLSLEDRRIFVRTGSLARNYLTEKQIDHVYASVIPSLEKRNTFAALETAVSNIGSYLSKYRGKHPTSPDSDNPRTGASVPLFFRDGPLWWDLELSIVFIIALFLVVIACCNGVGGPEAARKKRERRHVLRKLDIVRSEYVAAMHPQYAPSTCPYCQDDLALPWEPTVPTLPSTGANLQSTNDQPRNVHIKPTRTLRCGHTFHESCFDNYHSGLTVSTPECPVCKDRGGGTTPPPALSSTRDQDFSFRLNRLHGEYPHIITSAILAKLESEDPGTWPETMTEAYLRRSSTRQDRQQRETTDGGWWPGVGGALAAGGIGALIGSMAGNWGRRGGYGSSYTDIPSENGGHVGRWGTNESQLGGGGHGAGWGNALSGAASRFSGGGGLGRSWGFGGSGQGNYGSGGGGGHGTGW